MNKDNYQLLEALTPEVVQNLRRAIELGKWPNGERLTQEQKETCMQAVIAYEAKHLAPEQRTGYVPPKKQSTTKADTAPDQEKPITWR